MCPFEIIVVDNGSTDGSGQNLGVRFPTSCTSRFEENAGFARACNAGAELARSHYLLFLNNDAQVQPGWLPALLNDVHLEFDRVGAVGPKVLFPDGRLQDAGSTINADCTSVAHRHLRRSLTCLGSTARERWTTCRGSA